MATTSEDRLRLSPQEVAVESAKSEIAARQARLAEIEAERLPLKDHARRDEELRREARRLQDDIAIYEEVVKKKGEVPFAPPPSTSSGGGGPCVL